MPSTPTTAHVEGSPVVVPDSVVLVGPPVVSGPVSSLAEDEDGPSELTELSASADVAGSIVVETDAPELDAVPRKGPGSAGFSPSFGQPTRQSADKVQMEPRIYNEGTRRHPAARYLDGARRRGHGTAGFLVDVQSRCEGEVGSYPT